MILSSGLSVMVYVIIIKISMRFFWTIEKSVLISKDLS
jgi:hypothetical protein